MKLLPSKKKKCPGGKCERCIWFREFRYTNEETGEHKVLEGCGIEHLLDAIPQIYRSIDGCQTAANEARNRIMEIQQQALENDMLKWFPEALETWRTMDEKDLAFFDLYPGVKKLLPKWENNGVSDNKADIGTQE